MKWYMKHWALAAAMVVLTTGHAETVTASAGSSFTALDPGGSGRSADTLFKGGGGTLEYSNGLAVVNGIPAGSVGGLVGVLNMGVVQLAPIDNSVIYELPVILGGEQYRGVVKIDNKVGAISADTVTGQILTESLVGGAEHVAARIAGVLNGGDVKVSNLRIDLANKAVIADMEGTPMVFSGATWAPGATAVKKDLVLWTITDISGPTAVRPAALLAASDGDFSLMKADGYTVVKTGDEHIAQGTNVFGNLKVTRAGFDFFASSLGIKPTGYAYAKLDGVNDQPDGWGSITSTISFSTVPEPSTYTLMGLGLVGISLVARRRQAA